MDSTSHIKCAETNSVAGPSREASNTTDQDENVTTTQGLEDEHHPSILRDLLLNGLDVTCGIKPTSGHVKKLHNYSREGAYKVDITRGRRSSGIHSDMEPRSTTTYTNATTSKLNKPAYEKKSSWSCGRCFECYHCGCFISRGKVHHHLQTTRHRINTEEHFRALATTTLRKITTPSEDNDRDTMYDQQHSTGNTSSCASNYLEKSPIKSTPFLVNQKSTTCKTTEVYHSSGATSHLEATPVFANNTLSTLDVEDQKTDIQEPTYSHEKEEGPKRLVKNIIHQLALLKKSLAEKGGREAWEIQEEYEEIAVKSYNRYTARKAHNQRTTEMQAKHLAAIHDLVESLPKIWLPAFTQCSPWCENWRR